MESTNQDQLNNLFELSIDAKAREQLKVAATWARIIAIIAFISAGISILELFLMPSVGAPAELVGSVIGVIIGLGITLLIYLFLYKFGSNMGTGLSGMNQELFNIALRNLKTFFKVIGILLIIALSCGVLFLFVFMLSSSMR